MDPNVEIKRLLDEDHAVLKRQGNHLVWGLSNGLNFVQPKTPGDPRSAMNSLSNLKHVLGIVVGRKTMMEPERKNGVATPATTATVVETHPPAPPTILDRLHQQIEDQQWLWEYYMAEATAAEKRLTALQDLLKYADLHPDCAEDLLKALVVPTAAAPQPVAPLPTPVRTVAPVAHHVAVTRELVALAVECLPSEFYTNEVLERMIGDVAVSSDERRRIRSSIIGCLQRMVAEGKIIQTLKGQGRGPKDMSRYARHITVAAQPIGIEARQ